MKSHRNPRARLSKPPPPDNQRAELPPPELAFDIAQAHDLLQALIGRVDAMAYATERNFERFGWFCRDAGDEDDYPVGHLSQLISAVREASMGAVDLGRVIADELAKRGGAV